MMKVCNVFANPVGFVRISILIMLFHLKESPFHARIAALVDGRYMGRTFAVGERKLECVRLRP